MSIAGFAVCQLSIGFSIGFGHHGKRSEALLDDCLRGMVTTFIDHSLKTVETGGNVGDHGLFVEEVPVVPIVRGSRKPRLEIVEPFQGSTSLARRCQSKQDDVVNRDACIEASIGQASKQFHRCVGLVRLDEGNGHRRERPWVKQVTDVLHVNDQLLGVLRHSDVGKEPYGGIVGLVVEMGSNKFCFTGPKLSSRGVAIVLVSQKHRADDAHVRLKTVPYIEDEVFCIRESTQSCKVIGGGADV